MRHLKQMFDEMSAQSNGDEAKSSDDKKNSDIVIANLRILKQRSGESSSFKYCSRDINIFRECVRLFNGRIRAQSPKNQ